jgi:lipid II:glycine glycyltransferase (peptidoglycan interpeptide bridge formation enzyme)
MPKALALGEGRAGRTGPTMGPLDGIASWAAWDRFVAATEGGDIVQSSGWARAKRAIGFDICHVVCWRKGAIAGGALNVIKRLGPIKIGYIARGPLIDGAGRADLAGILDEIEAAMRARGIHHVIIQPPEGGDAIAPSLAVRGYALEAPSVAPTATLRIDLSGDLDRIRSGMSAGKRRGLRRSERHGVEVRIGGPEDIDLFQSLYEATARRQGFVPLSATYLRHHWQSLRATGSMQVFFAHHQGRELAAL